MGVSVERYNLIETNILLDRFLTYREVFTEYFKTIKVIERGEALRYETYSRLVENYMINVHQFIKLCNSYVVKYHLEKSFLAEALNNYFVSIISALDCLDIDNNLVDHRRLEAAKKKIHASEEKFMKSIGRLAN
ncbi:hypothetical protein EGT49_06960 [Companilactobacillus suantsaicola]|uniref:Uncharacterized protein n=1 Tax=Companilactobacillus suantsaicola TaxID=2487723 RepID=A0A4Z0JJ45_9LACO|nr:hypothetical protein [Companilactobacillus suantsaicola]TGD23069.1 hypothetical protein EGT49_06960 [Companilactobacillus suantsaicola]